MICTDGIATGMCKCVPLAAISLTCHWVNVYVDIVQILYMYECIYVHACMSLYHYILLLIIWQDMVSVQ